MTDTPIIYDQDQRLRALDPSTSFIVQAPAGSGKTELLTQRVLVLLSCVDTPEEILAITFTKKAAFEMRARIIHALQKAENQPEPELAHAKQTWQLAKKALVRNAELNWNLLANPNRLRIQTIDSFNASLIKHLPMLSHFGAPPEIADDSNQLYEQAVQTFLSHLEETVEWSDAIAHLLNHLDNDLNKVQQLLIDMLGKRDQWLPYIMMAMDEEALRKQLEQELEQINHDCLSNLQKTFPLSLQAVFLPLARFAGSNVPDNNPIARLKDLTTFPGHELTDKATWLSIKNLLLTADLQWRKRLDKNGGFPAPGSSTNKIEKQCYTDMKQAMTDLINQLLQEESLRLAFETLNSVPDTNYNATQWDALSALYQVLRIVVAQLHVKFREAGKIDYIENAQAALYALGSDEAPTDLALTLDYQIKHILIDEFQDTSNSQYRLLEKLIMGWEANDGRSLFIVGDPMQSIYRFREADVGLFIRAQQRGIAQLPLEPLTLSVNFRSTSTIVSWVNTVFADVFPKKENMSTGAVPYSQSKTLHREETRDSHVVLHAFNDKSLQANALIQQIKTSQAEHPEGSIAILVRSRTHLSDIIPLLKAANIPYRAIDIDRLNARSIIQDMMALTRAMLHLSDRISWLAVLRAPWCGLSLYDLHVIASDNAHDILWKKLDSYSTLKDLSIDGRQRLDRIVPILQSKLAEKRRHSLRLWIESTWLLLGGPACIQQENDLADINEYFGLLDKLDQGGDLVNAQELDYHVGKLFAAPNNSNANLVQIMTVHNAKGLEFDTVILPHLEKKSPGDDKQLLLWMERIHQNESRSFMLAPIHATGMETDTIYQYIKEQQSIKLDYETSRLLYVAVTRAKKNLHLFFHIEVSEKDQQFIKPSHKSLLEKMLPIIQSQITLQTAPDIDNTDNIPATKNLLKRITLNWKNPIHEITQAQSAKHQAAPGFSLHQQLQRQIGIATHKVIQHLCQWGVTWWEQKNLKQQQHFLQYLLHQNGVLNENMEESRNLVLKAVENILKDKQGRWIIQPHKQAQSEFALTHMSDGEANRLILDRTFVNQDDVRWIIDYKTSVPDHLSLTDFLTSEKIKYAPQMNIYREAIKQIDERAIRVALYFPLIPAWIEYEKEET